MLSHSFTRGIQLTLALLSLVICCCEKNSIPNATTNEAPQTEKAASSANLDVHAQLAKLPGQNTISAKCLECHGDIHKGWHGSHHGQANRLVDMKQDSLPFSGQKFHSGKQDWSFTKDTGQLHVTANGKSHKVGMAIGKDPLIQYLVAASNGKWQTPNAAWDPKEKEWFDVFGGDERTEADWGHFLGRGMNWNTQCAWCHMTDYQKNYDLKTDTYQSTWTEMGVGCTQCHGGLADHPDKESGCLIDLKKQQEFKEANPDFVYDSCATCHSRRTPFDDHFKVGNKFADHYGLQLPTQEHLYYPDGQIKDEVYVWTSLRTSNMGHKGVQCGDCHDPHTNQLILPVHNNQLCMSCHAGGTNGRIAGAPLIDPVSHSHHGIDSTGNSCVECHMTHTTYMGRDPRRDHGFHVPDPQMTKEHGIPNACNKCHTDQDADWAIKWTTEWYGDKLNTPERKRQRARTRAIATAYSGDPSSIDALLTAFDNEQNPYWQASLLQIMMPWAQDERVQYHARNGANNKDPIVRASACQLMGFSTGNEPWLKPMLQDPIKEVRLAAAWSHRAQLEQNSKNLEELKSSVLFSVDQPSGAMRMMQMAFEAGDFEKAEKWIIKAISLDKTSAGTYADYAVLLGQMGRSEEAIQQLENASKLEATNPRFPYLMALAYGELGQKDKVEELLRKSLKLDRNNERAWYNLGLILAEQEKLDEAIKHILTCVQINPQNPEYPYALATLYLRKGDKAAAFEACRTVLGLDRNHQGARNLLGRIGNPNQ